MSYLDGDCEIFMVVSYERYIKSKPVLLVAIGDAEVVLKTCNLHFITSFKCESFFEASFRYTSSIFQMNSGLFELLRYICEMICLKTV